LFAVFQSALLATAENIYPVSACLYHARRWPSAGFSTISFRDRVSRCGFGWKANTYSTTPAFFAHDHQIAGRLVHSLWARQRFYPSLFAYYPQLPQASTVTTVFI
jgi:hypothetical protein